MIPIMIYILTVIYFSYTLYKYLTFEEQCKVTNCFDEGAEHYISIMKSDEYDYH